ncbi:hypothetical protein DFJ58DRAFT_917250 [Suillus subalutaceus]|uniref:uncharacterized protein n=1 Tax=Suillus subalutaceus TaxID=48586 RepID=UPI001B85CD57|nr:uncharacterized protein DFJ58DRAFT_917250 [Suillus subalutaceus]KAG1838095.1 hypothetical protein DFJ58DRAFT_917250 [Suillus subalutaceus]
MTMSSPACPGASHFLTFGSTLWPGIFLFTVVVGPDRSQIDDVFGLTVVKLPDTIYAACFSALPGSQITQLQQSRHMDPNGTATQSTSSAGAEVDIRQETALFLCDFGSFIAWYDYS